MTQDLKYLKLLSEKYPNRQSVCTEIINLAAIMNLPKGTEHFMSDIHGEYEAFLHIMNNCSGVIREKIEMIFGDRLTEEEQRELRTLIYYPRHKIRIMKAQGQGKLSPKWYRKTLREMVEIARVLSSKYTRSKVRKAMPQEFAYIIDELLHALPDEGDNQQAYHERILDTIVGIQNGDEFIKALSNLIKRLAVDHLHIVGDLFDRGADADKIIDLLMDYHSLDIQWGNHDILWMGAASGSDACITNVVRNNVRYHNIRILESGYAISLRKLQLFAERTYEGDPHTAMVKAINMLVTKSEGQAILRHPEFEMKDRLLMYNVNRETGMITIGDKEYQMNTAEFPTVDWEKPYEYSPEEAEVMDDLRASFRSSQRLKKHIEFLYSVGSIYLKMNDNLLFHGCVPLNADGTFLRKTLEGREYSGKAFMDYCDRVARQAFHQGDRYSLDFMWYLWCGTDSPVCGRNVKTFARAFIADESAWHEPRNPYYTWYNEEEKCREILAEFGLTGEDCRIVNGHTPVRVSHGESPLKAGGRLVVIDGGFCRAYQKTTGIAGYTLIANSHGMRLMSHQPFTSLKDAQRNGTDIHSQSYEFAAYPKRRYNRDTDHGKVLRERMDDLVELLNVVGQGLITLGTR